MLEYQPQNYTIAESSIFVPLQNMLNKSIERLCNSIALNWKENDLYNLQMICTLGFDSSSGHTNPQQHFENSVNENSDPHLSLFVTSMILIKLESSVSDSCFWINPTPQSTRFCRPLRIALEKEESENTMNEHKRLSAEIDNLLQYKFKMCNGKTVRVKFVVSQTLFNGKCINTIVGNKASSRCPMCGRTAHEFGNLNNDFAPKQSSLKFGLGLLHAEIKAFEHLLHISYRKTIETWDVRKHLKGN